ncbi:hypothetical protein ACIQOU_11115 [Streptomyces sp. NPDC091279]|uniref:hypothetical protein n=1 Tax=unclassified Streptomyces TaxID=2593676 RepID=UPI00381A2DC6
MQVATAFLAAPQMPVNLPEDIKTTSGPYTATRPRAASARSGSAIGTRSIKTSEGGAARGFDEGKRTTGRERHVIVDTTDLPLVVAVTPVGFVDGHAPGPVARSRGYCLL